MGASEGHDPSEVDESEWPHPGAARLSEDYFQRPSPARLWNYLQGGKDNYQLDREAGDRMAERYPGIFDMARQTRLFLMRAVEYLATAGVSQFLDVGCGLPAPYPYRNTHEIAQELLLDSRVVYVDSDPVVMAHARALLVGSAGDGGTSYVEADVRQTDRILTSAATTLDFDRPIAVLLLGVLGAISYPDALAAVATIKSAVCSGSYLLHEDGVALTSERQAAVADRNKTGMNRYELRAPEELARFYSGWELIEPGQVSVVHWRPTVTNGAGPPVEEFGALARKP